MTHHWVKHEACRAGHLHSIGDVALCVKGAHPELGGVSGVWVDAWAGCATEALSSRVLRTVDNPGAQATMTGAHIHAAGNCGPGQRSSANAAMEAVNSRGRQTQHAEACRKAWVG
jgi:hypothetical protein